MGKNANKYLIFFLVFLFVTNIILMSFSCEIVNYIVSIKYSPDKTPHMYLIPKKMELNNNLIINNGHEIYGYKMNFPFEIKDTEKNAKGSHKYYFEDDKRLIIKKYSSNDSNYIGEMLKKLSLTPEEYCLRNKNESISEMIMDLLTKDIQIRELQYPEEIFYCENDILQSINYKYNSQKTVTSIVLKKTNDEIILVTLGFEINEVISIISSIKKQ